MLDLGALFLRIPTYTSTALFIADVRFMLQARMRFAAGNHDMIAQQAYSSSMSAFDAELCPHPAQSSTAQNLPLMLGLPVDSVVREAGATRLLIRLRRAPQGMAMAADGSRPDWLAVLPDGQLAPGSQGYHPDNKRRCDSSGGGGDSAAIVLSGRGKKGPPPPLGGMASTFEPKSPQHSFWKGIELVWNLMGMPAAGSSILCLFLLYLDNQCYMSSFLSSTFASHEQQAR